MEIEGNNIQYYPFWKSNVIITPNARPSVCNRNKNNRDYLRYSWQQIYEFPETLLSQTSLSWPQKYITDYQFTYNANAKSLWIDTFEFSSSFNGNFSELQCAYFKLTVTQFDESDNFISSIQDYIAIQFVFDLPISYAIHSIVHNVDDVLTISIHDFFKFSDLLMSDDWITNIYKFKWQCSVYDEEEKQYSKQCSLNCPFNDLLNENNENNGNEAKGSSETHKVFDYGCFDRTKETIYQISLTVQLDDKYINIGYSGNSRYKSSIIYIHTTNLAIPDTSWDNIPQILSLSERYSLSIKLRDDKIFNVSYISWTCSDKNMCPNNQSLYESFSFFHFYTDYDSKLSQIIINPYKIREDDELNNVYDNYGCYVGQNILNEGEQFELQMIADDEYLIATISLSTSLNLRGGECTLSATDNALIPMVTVFTIKCDEFTTSTSPLMYNFLLINNNLPNDQGTWMNEKYLFSSFFQFVLGAGNYSLRVIMQNLNGDIHCYTITQNITISIPNNDNEYIKEINQYGMNIINNAVSAKDDSKLIQNSLALSNTLCSFDYKTPDIIIDILNVYINISHHVSNINYLNDFFRNQLSSFLIVRLGPQSHFHLNSMILLLPQ